MPRFYDPNQPRVAKGETGGGRWTHFGADHGQGVYFAPSSKSQDGPAEPVQKVFLAPVVAPVVAPAVVTAKSALITGVAAALSGLAWLSARSIFAQSDGDLRALSYTITEDKLDRKNPSPVTEQELRDICKYKDVVDLTNEAAGAVNKELGRTGQIVSAAVYGTRVHAKLAELIKKGNQNEKHKAFGLAAEPSAIKMADETELSMARARALQEQYRNKKIPYGIDGTVRIDVLQLLAKENAVCIFDVKTGDRRIREVRMAILADSIHERVKAIARTHERAKEVIESIGHAFPSVNPSKIITAEVRPTVPRPQLKRGYVK
jgi:hypothetical protein